MEYLFSLFLGTFVLEDLALASGVALVAENKVSFAAAFAACFLGITLGDIGLYLIGFVASRLQFRHPFLMRLKHSNVLSYSIVISRMVPGTRWPTYVGAGYLRYSFLKFLLLTVASVFVWVGVALAAGATLSSIFMHHWVIAVLAFLFLLHLFKTYAPPLLNYWDRRALLHGFRKWGHFEFWPAWVFYLPIVPYYIFLSIKYRSLMTPFYAAPELENGGLIGESKWDFLKYLDPRDPATLKSVKLSQDCDFLSARDLIEKENFSYPFIMKPDVGQRGYAVRILRNDFDLTEYLLLSPFERIAQKLSLLEMEAGLFYVRRPSESSGQIFSVTDKIFPYVTGDGKTKLGDLILKDRRARIIAPIYFSRLRDRLDEVPDNDVQVFLAECGNHCQGAIFLNGRDLITESLTKEIDRIAKRIPHFYFGRLDIRYRSVAGLMAGRDFEIVEINGAGSEATHIWDARTKLIEAYRTLFRQWDLLFAIGHEVKRTHRGAKTVSAYRFIKEVVRVVFRRDSLSVSS